MISKRLEMVAQLVPRNVRMADIGCDHAYLPITLLQREQVTLAIGCDVNKGPLEAAKRNIDRMSFDVERLQLRLGNGLQVLKPGEVDVVTIAGMGADLMIDIFSASPEVMKRLSRIVASPNVAPWLVRRWAMEHHFAICEEKVVCDNNRFYEVFAFEPTCEKVVYSEMQLYFGVKLPQDEEEVTKAYFEKRRLKDHKLLAAWEEVRTYRPEVAAQYDWLSSMWKAWEECHR